MNGSHSTSASGPTSHSAASRLAAATRRAYARRLGASRCAANDARSVAFRTSHTRSATTKTHRSFSDGHFDALLRFLLRPSPSSESESPSEFGSAFGGLAFQSSSATRATSSAAVEYIASKLAVTSSTSSKSPAKFPAYSSASSSSSASVRIVSRGGRAILCSANECFSPTHTDTTRLIPATLNGAASFSFSSVESQE